MINKSQVRPCTVVRFERRTTPQKIPKREALYSKASFCCRPATRKNTFGPELKRLESQNGFDYSDSCTSDYSNSCTAILFANPATCNPRAWVQRLFKLTVIHRVREFELIRTQVGCLLKIVMGHFCYPSAHVQAEMRLNTLK